MPSVAFIRQKEVGREFEKLMMPVLEGMGFRVIDTDHWSYESKRGQDVVVEIQGERCSLEFKLDKLSESTGNVAIDLDSIDHTKSAIWIYGLPEGNQIQVYAMFIKDLAPFARNYPRKNIGEFKRPCSLIPKAVFITQPFVKQLKTITV